MGLEEMMGLKPGEVATGVRCCLWFSNIKWDVG